MSQSIGIVFEHNNWKAILTKAKLENKYIFVDCFTTWCGPCKFMDRNIYPLKNVGDFYNAQFINVKFQLDTTSTDSENIKLQYADADLIKNKYEVTSYPTFLFFNSNGELVQIEGGGSNEAEFITKGKNAIDPNKQYITQTNKYTTGNRDPAFLRNLAFIAKHALKDSLASKYAKEYLQTQNDLFTRDNMQFINETTQNIADTGFSLVLHNIEKFETILSKEKILNSLTTIVVQSEFSDTNIKVNMSSKEWNIYSTKIRKLYPDFGEEVIINIKTIFFNMRSNWGELVKAADEYATSKSPLPSPLNICAWIIFKKCDKPKLLEHALLWSKKSFDKMPKIQPDYMETYANLLYKLGRNRAALDWEIKAQKIAIQGGAEKKWGQSVIDKIKKGEKTW